MEEKREIQKWNKIILRNSTFSTEAGFLCESLAKEIEQNIEYLLELNTCFGLIFSGTYLRTAITSR